MLIRKQPLRKEFHKAFNLPWIIKRQIHNLKQEVQSEVLYPFGWNCVVDCSRVGFIYPEHDDKKWIVSPSLKATVFRMM
jgi:hypothetical protein